MAMKEMLDPTYGPLSNLGQLVLLATFLFNSGIQIWRERRNRKWQLEDAQRQQDALKAHEIEMKKTLDRQTEEIKRSAQTRVTDFSERLNHLLDEHNKGRRHDD